MALLPPPTSICIWVFDCTKYYTTIVETIPNEVWADGRRGAGMGLKLNLNLGVKIGRDGFMATFPRRFRVSEIGRVDELWPMAATSYEVCEDGHDGVHGVWI